MIRIRKGIVKRIVANDQRTTIADVLYDDKMGKAINYNFITGSLIEGDTVYINTSASYLSLGTGGYDYVIINETRGAFMDLEAGGHIMKMRYTPYQIKCNCPSEENNKFHNDIMKFKSLEGMAVIIGELHSMLPPTACCLKYLNKSRKIAYIMTDGGSLPIDISFSVKELIKKGIVLGTVTSGNAFGGDVEAVNIYDALIAAKVVLKCNAAIITMGPGIVGTGTKYGFSGIEQGYIIDAINTLNGIAVFIPRLSFKDSRDRHYGISHHTITILNEISKTKAHVIFPCLGGKKMEIIKSQITRYNLNRMHDIQFIDSDTIFKALDYYNVTVNTMGRSLEEDREFFMACGSAAYYVNSLFDNLPS